MENRNEDIHSRNVNNSIRGSRSTGAMGSQSTGAAPSGYNPEPGTAHGEGLTGRQSEERLSNRREKVDQRGGSSLSPDRTFENEKTGARAGERDFSTHYYGNERDLRERDRRARESDIGREPYEPRHSYSSSDRSSSYGREEFGNEPRRNWKQLYNEFFTDFSGLVRKESELIRTELGEKTSLIKQGAVSITTGSIVAFVGVQAIAATLVIALGYVVSWWLAALITGVGLLLIGMALMATAKKKLSSDSLTPHRSMESFDHMGSMFKEKRDEITRH